MVALTRLLASLAATSVATPGPRRRAVLLAASASLVLSACLSVEPDDEAEALQAITEFNRQYLQAINEGDIEQLASLTTDDHMMISSGGAPLSGKEALVNAMTGAFERFDFEETWAPEETVISGDLAYQRGTFVVVARPKAGGEPSRTEGNFLRIYRQRSDGAWFMVRDSFNSD